MEKNGVRKIFPISLQLTDYQCVSLYGGGYFQGKYLELLSIISNFAPLFQPFVNEVANSAG